MRLEVKNLEKSFKSEKVLQDINLDFTDGHIYGIIGRNGSGKSVLFKIICGFMHADGGTVGLDGKIIGKDIDFPENMGAIMENPDLIVLDEPMNGLDEQGVTEMRELFLKLKEEHKLILMASHNREDIDMLCDEVYHIEKGKIEKVR